MSPARWSSPGTARRTPSLPSAGFYADSGSEGDLRTVAKRARARVARGESGGVAGVAVPPRHLACQYFKREGRMSFGNRYLHAKGPWVASKDGAMQGEQAPFSKG